MATIIFDFDSTLIRCESLEWILKEQLDGKPEIKEQVHEITLKGLNGTIPFSDSLAKRLELAAPNRNDVMDFGQKALDMITLGMPELIRKYKNDGVDIWVVSGGLRESLLPVCKSLEISEGHVMGVQLLWGERGEFAGIDPADFLSRSKVEGASQAASRWSRPSVIIGDAMSDYRLFEQGVVDEFVLYTEHIECKEIAQRGVNQAKSAQELKEVIDAILR